MNDQLNPIINIITRRSAASEGGPYKVFRNTCKGFDRLGQRYVINKRIGDYQWNWIHDCSDALFELAVKRKSAVIGPVVAVMPKDLPILRPRFSGSVFLLASQWQQHLWTGVGFNDAPVFAWPSAVDFDEYLPPQTPRSSKDVLVYFKKRDHAVLSTTIDVLTELGFRPRLVSYGSYLQDEYIALAKKCCFGVWLGMHESQGYALLEAMATGLPFIVMNESNFVFNAPDRYPYPAEASQFLTTSAPYFDSRCGIIINQFDEFAAAIGTMIGKLQEYNPRGYVEEHFGYEQCASQLLDYFKMLPMPRATPTKIVERPFALSRSASALLILNALLFRLFRTNCRRGILGRFGSRLRGQIKE